MAQYLLAQAHVEVDDTCAGWATACPSPRPRRARDTPGGHLDEIVFEIVRDASERAMFACGEPSIKYGCLAGGGWE